MTETKLQLNQRVILHKRGKEKQRLVDIEVNKFLKFVKDDEPMIGDYVYSPFVPIMKYKPDWNW